MPNGPSVWLNRCEFYRTKRILKTAGFLYVIFTLVFIFLVNIGIFMLLYSKCPCPFTVQQNCAAYQHLKHTKRMNKMSNRCFCRTSLTSTWENLSWFYFFLFFNSTHLWIIVRRIVLYCSKSFNQVPVSMSHSYYWQCLRQYQHLHCPKMTWE